MNDFLRISVLCTILLIANGDEDGCTSPMTCISSSACLTLHGGAGNLYNGIIFQCGETTSSGNDKVCCPPIKNTAHTRQQSPPTTRPTTRRTTKKPGVKPTPIMPLMLNVNLEKHKNFRLLPMDACGTQFAEKIVNGENANLGEFPWMALLGYSDPAKVNISYYCGGTLITDRFVLTAAHCVDTAGAGTVLKSIRLGELDLTQDPDCVENDEYCAPNVQEYDVDKVTPHPDYNPRTLKNDIALVRLKSAVTKYNEYVRPICLPFNLTNITGAEEARYRVAGWGKTDYKENEGSPILKYAYIRSISIEDCNMLQKNAGERMLTETQLCAGGGTGEDACKGDSGGPLMHVKIAGDPPRVVQIGVVSYGFRNCGSQGIPSVYTRVSTYLRWILDNIST